MGELFVLAFVAVIVLAFWRLLRPGKRKAAKGPPVRIVGDGDYSLDAVGESHYQSALDRIAGGRTQEGHEFSCKAEVIPEKGNPHDPNAVRVEINGKLVGYLSRANAVKFRKCMADAGLRKRSAQCDALIVGGWNRGIFDKGSYGVKLDMILGKKFRVTE